MDWSAYSRLTFDYPADGVLLIKINRPDRLNAMTFQMFDELARLAAEVGADELLPDTGDEVPDDAQVDVGLQQGQADLA